MRQTTKMLFVLMLAGGLVAGCKMVEPGGACSADADCAGDFYCAAVGVCTRPCASEDDCRVDCATDAECPGLFEQCVEGLCEGSGAVCRDGYCAPECPGGPCDFDPYGPQEDQP